MEEGPQLNENDLPDEVLDYVERAQYGQTEAWPFIGKRYIDGEIAVHLHYRIRGGIRDQKGGDYCAVYHRGPFSDHSYGSNAVTGGFDTRGNANGLGENETLVFIYVRQMLEGDQRPVLLRVRSVETLKHLDECLRLGSDTTDVLCSALVEGILVAKDGELNRVEIAPSRRVLQGKGVGESVEGASHVLHDVTDDQIEAVLERRENDHPRVPHSGVFVVLEGGAIGLTFHKALDLGLESVEVMACPV